MYDYRNGETEEFEDVQELMDEHNEDDLSNCSFFTNKRKLANALRGLKELDKREEGRD
jgi:hypothetical protein